MSYVASGVVFLMELGIGTALTVLVDATLIRVVLLSVAMRLAGRANWWAPRPLRRLRVKEAPARTPADRAARPGRGGRPGPGGEDGPDRAGWAARAGKAYSAGSTCDHHARVTSPAAHGV
ncbi:hypothetical protein ACIQ8D_22945 [Streptomyces sp. NPDC096094]|uniref:hypothetical protein n=1 Tax=Streptomyces sp. NPDC096094 TaxID=3366073 RepID=UPI00380D5446